MKTLLYTEDFEAARTEIRRLGGRVSARLSPRVIAASLPDDVALSALRASAAEPPSALDDRDRTGIAAWRGMEEVRAQRVPGERRGRPDLTAERAPCVVPEAAEAGARTFSNSALSGDIAVGLVVVGGAGSYNGKSLTITAEELVKIDGLATDGLTWLAEVEPRSDVTWHFDYEFVNLDTPVPDVKTVDAALMHPNGKAYFFLGAYYERYTPGKSVDEGYPKLIRDVTRDAWKKWPADWSSGVNAAMQYGGNVGYFFRGPDCLRYTFGEGVDDGYPKRIFDEFARWPPSWADGVDAAMFTGKEAYFFKGPEYLRYTPGTGVDPGYPRLIVDDWTGWPATWAGGVDAALFYENGKAYFFKGGQYLRYTVGTGVDQGYPKPIVEHWHKLFEPANNNGFPGSHALPIEAWEKPWRDAALQAMNFATVTEYVEHICAASGATRGYAAFFTKYPTGWFAYERSYDHTVIQYANDGWGVGAIDQVFAHESCHVFGAKDEYSSSGCNCDSAGALHVPNGNCGNCNDHQVSCLMDENDFLLCGWTRGQIGWDFGLRAVHGSFVYTNDKMYFFDGAQYSRCTKLPNTDDHYPKVIADEWKKWPADWADGVDAAMVFTASNPAADVKKAYFFKGAKYLRYTPGVGVDKGYPKTIATEWKKWPAAWADGVDAAVGVTTEKAYFFKGAEYLRYTRTDGVNAGYPKKIADEWIGWPIDWADGVDSVMWRNEKFYFFKGRQYLRYTPGVGVDDGYPRGIPEAWPGLLTWQV